jgi:uncharacterized repeat protein (TIGR01451 family)
MDLGTPPVTPPTVPQLPPPSLSVEGGDNKFSTPGSGAAVPPVPSVPNSDAAVPPVPGGLGSLPPQYRPPLPVPPAPPVVPDAKGFPVLPAPERLPIAPPVGPGVAPSGTVLNVPGKVSQSVTVEAVCPETVVYNTEFKYELVVRNTGNVAVQNVRVEDEIPAGARYIGSDPPGELNGDKLVWALGALDGATDRRIVVRVRPTEEGEIRSRAAVAYSAVVEAKSRVTRPRITVAVTAPEVARAGEEAAFRIKVTNSGTGPAQHMVLKALLTDGLNYRNVGNELVSKLANLPAGESKELPLPLSATKAGLQKCQVTVTAEGSQDATAQAAVNVVEPQLQIAQTGPAKCLVRAEPQYDITLSNPGTAATDGVVVQTVLPDGFDFVLATEGGTYNATYRSVSWKLAALPAGGTRTVGLKLHASAAGDVALRTTAVSGPEPAAAVPAAGPAAPIKPAGRVLEAKADTPIKAEGVAAVRFDVKGLENPVEVGKDAVYEIRVTNQGTGACTNVQLMAAMAEGTSFSSANGPTTVKAQGQTLVFDPIATLPVKGGDVVYTVRVRGTVAGDQRFRVQLTCDQVRSPVVKEESTSFYKQ